MTVASSAIRSSLGEMKAPAKIYLSSVACMNLMKPEYSCEATT
jgi:hypothetical protein